MKSKRTDHLIISDMVEKFSRVLDVGCADGQLLHLLRNKKDISGQGIEINYDKVEVCLKKGLSVVEGDANKEIINFPKNSFDYVILSQTLQTVQRPSWILEEILRVGKKAIISFPNFGHWSCRYQLCMYGKMPITEELKLAWYDTQNIHLCTLKDFQNLIRKLGFKIEKRYGIDKNKNIIKNLSGTNYLNLFAAHAVFLISN